MENTSSNLSDHQNRGNCRELVAPSQATSLKHERVLDMQRSGNHAFSALDLGCLTTGPIKRAEPLFQKDLAKRLDVASI